MKDHLLIRLRPAQDGGVDWARFSREAEGDPQTGWDRLEDLTRQAEGARVTVLVPSAEVLLTRVKLPVKNRQRLLRAIPYALEDQLAEDVETLHFALGRREEDGAIGVAVVSRAQMDGWIEELSSAGIVADAFVPEVLAVPWSPESWSVLPMGDDVLVRTSDQEGFAVEAANAGSWLSAALEEAEDDAPAVIHVFARQEAVTGLEPFGADRLRYEDGRAPMAWLSHGIGNRVPLNLQQGPYGRQEKLGSYFRPWRPVAALLAVWAVLQGAGVVVDGIRLEQEHDALGAQVTEVFRSTFPEVKRVVNARVQMERGLADLRKRHGSLQEDFLRLLVGGTAALRQVNGIEVKRMRYQNGRLDLELVLADMSGLDPLRQALQAQGSLEANIVSAASREGVVEGKIRITGK